MKLKDSENKGTEKMFSSMKQSCERWRVGLRQVWNEAECSRRLQAHWRLLILMTILGVAGCLLLKSIAYNTSQMRAFASWQLLWLAIGMLLLLLCFVLPTSFFRRYLPAAVLFSYALLWGVLLLGERIYGAVRWYRFYGLCLQPSELAKPAFLLAFAWCWRLTRQWSEKSRLLISVALAALWLLPIACQPDWGTAMIYGATVLLMLYGLGLGWRPLLACLAAGAISTVWVVTHYPYVRRRVWAFLGWGGEQLAGAGWQSMQMRKCLIKGGWSGILFSSSNDQVVLPFRHNDSIFAAATEVLGVVGVLPLILLCLGWVGYCCYLAGKNSRRWTYPIYLGAGVMLTGQAFVHLGVNLGVLPTTGVNLPLISYGGSSLVATLLIVGMVQRCAWEDERREENRLSRT